MRAAGLDVPELFALCLFIVSFQVHHGEKLIGDLGRHLSPRVHQLVVRQPMLEGADDVVLLNEKKRVLLEEAANIRAQGLVIALQDLVQHPPIARSFPRAAVLAGEEGAELVQGVNAILREPSETTSTPHREHVLTVKFR
jgi:hypothetical protein